jgi:hypothetical protein
MVERLITDGVVDGLGFGGSDGRRSPTRGGQVTPVEVSGDVDGFGA